MPRHDETKVVPFTPLQMFDMVADVGKYPQFLPWCIGARVRSRSETEQRTELTIGFGPFRESFSSKVSMQRPHDDVIGLVAVRHEAGPFRYLNNQWKFSPHPKGCLVEFWVEFEFSSRVLQSAMGVVFHEATRRMMNAFLKRGRDIYGTQAVNAPASLTT